MNFLSEEKKKKKMENFLKKFSATVPVDSQPHRIVFWR